MLTLLVPILISFLLETSQLRTATKFSIQLHEAALQWLMKIGPKYPQVSFIFFYHVRNANLSIYIKFRMQEFKALMGQAPELKNKLESAIRCSQQQAANVLKLSAESKENKTASTAAQQQQPTIKLKTDFSNFS